MRLLLLALTALLAAGLPASAQWGAQGPAGSVARPQQYQCIDQHGNAALCQFTDVPSAEVAPPFTPPAAEKKALVVTASPNSGLVPHASVSALGTSLLVKGAPGQLLGFNCTAITGSAAGYCVAYNAATVPSTGALTGAQVLDVCYFAASPAGCSLSRIPDSVRYSNGIVILVTSASTPFTYTTGVLTAFVSADFQ